MSGVLAWRLTAGPIQFDWLAPRLENALNAQSKDYVFDIGGTIITWSSDEGFSGGLIELQIKDFKVQTSTGIPVALFPTAGAKFDWWALFGGKIALKGLSIKNPTFAIKRFADGTFSVGESETSTPTAQPNTQSDEKAEEKAGEKIENTPPATPPTIIDETIKKQNINALMNTILLKSNEGANHWAQSLRFINISNGRVIFIEDGHNFKWTMPDLNATLFRNADDVTINASSNLTLTENFKDKTNAKIIKQGSVTIELVSPNSDATHLNDKSTLKNKIAMTLNNIDVRFISQFLIPNRVKLTYDEHLDGQLNLDLTQNWVPEIIDMDISSDLGKAKGDIVFLGEAGELSTNITLKDIKMARILPLLPKTFPVASHITQIDSRFDTTINSDRFSLLTGGKVTLDSTLYKGQFTLPKWLDTPIAYDTITTKTQLDFALSVSKPEGNTLTLQTTPIETRINTNKTTVQLDTQYKFADASSVSNIQVDLTDVAIESLKTSWPKPLIPDVRNWVINHMQGGQMNGTAKTRITHNKGITHVKSITGDVTVQGNTLTQYYQKLPDITNVNAKLSYDKNKMNIAFANATLGQNTLDGSKIKLSYKNNPTMALKLQTTGQAQEILALLEANTNQLDNSPIKSQNLTGPVTGQMAFNLSLGDKSIPLNAKINLKGENLKLNKPEWNMENMTVNASTFTMDNKTIQLTSENILDNHPLNIGWTHYRSGRNIPKISDTLKISGSLVPEKQTFGTFKLDEFAKGITQLDVTMNRYNSTKNWAVNASADVSKTAIKIPPLNWQKTDKTRGVISAKGVWTHSNALVVKDLKIRIMPKVSRGEQSETLSFTGGGRYDLNTSEFNNFTITNLASERFSLSAIYKKQNQQTYLKIKGDKADVDYITQNLAHLSSGEEKSAAHVTIDLKTVTAGNRGTLHNVKLDWVKNDQYTEQFKTSFMQDTVLLNAPKAPSKPIIKTPQTGDKQKTIHPEKPKVPQRTLSVITMVPKGRAFDLNANIHDAGGLIEFLDIDRGIKGGHTIVKAFREGPFSTVVGTIKTKAYHMSDAPNFGRLLQAISLVDIFKALSDEGIAFKRLEADFTWKGNVINFENGITNSSTVGFTFAGGMNTETKVVALQGTAIPFYGLSRIVGSIPIVGTILTAGEGIYAVNYSVEGDMKDPKITGNPLSALAPGILRKLFPSNADKSILKDKEPAPNPTKEIEIKSNANLEPTEKTQKTQQKPQQKTGTKPSNTTVNPAPTAPVIKSQ